MLTEGSEDGYHRGWGITKEGYHRGGVSWWVREGGGGGQRDLERGADLHRCGERCEMSGRRMWWLLPA